MAVVKFHEARETVIQKVIEKRGALVAESVPLQESAGRVLAEAIAADRDFPPFPRATRDGFAVRAADVAATPAKLRVMGQIKAGNHFAGHVAAGECVEIMTGAPVPDGADAVVMVEYTIAAGDSVEIHRSIATGDNIVARGSESRHGEELLAPGRRIGYGEVAMLAAVGAGTVNVYRKPRVAILPTGDEVVELDVDPGPYQIRNSNSLSLQAQVTAAHGVPLPLGIAPDREDRLREMIAEGLQSDVLLLSGGVSAGKFDLVEKVLAEFDTDIFFDGVLIQPGRPLVFGRAGKTFVFGLPGNPLSTMVTFELFVRPCLALLGDDDARPAPFLRARLARELRRKPGLEAFLPAKLTGDAHDPIVSLVEWKGSGDIASLTRANCFLVVPAEAAALDAGDWVSVLPRGV